jgi:hypothetical protein
MPIPDAPHLASLRRFRSKLDISSVHLAEQVLKREALSVGKRWRELLSDF